MFQNSVDKTSNNFRTGEHSLHLSTHKVQGGKEQRNIKKYSKIKRKNQEIINTDQHPHSAGKKNTEMYDL